MPIFIIHAHINLANNQEILPPYRVGQPISTSDSSDIKKDEAGYPPQVTGLGPTQNFLQQGYYPAPQQGYPLQPYPQVSKKLPYSEQINVINSKILVATSCMHGILSGDAS